MLSSKYLQKTSKPSIYNNAEIGEGKMSLKNLITDARKDHGKPGKPRNHFATKTINPESFRGYRVSLFSDLSSKALESSGLVTNPKAPGLAHSKTLRAFHGRGQGDFEIAKGGELLTSKGWWKTPVGNKLPGDGLPAKESRWNHGNVFA
jgi:hypothetical protein